MQDDSIPSCATQFYFGKCADTTGAVVTMLVNAKNKVDTTLAYCATGKPFSVLTPIDDPGLWLSSSTLPLAGLLNGLRIFGTKTECMTMPVAMHDQTLFWQTLFSWLTSGPVALGPLNRLRLLDRLEDRYYQGNAHFINVIGRQSASELIIHDPEGCPYDLRRTDELANAILPLQGTAAIRCTQIAPPLNLPVEILELGLSERVNAAARTDSSGTGIVSLAERIGCHLLTSEQAALKIGVAARGIALAHINTLLTMTGFPNLLDQYRYTCADILFALDSHDTQALRAALLICANHENELDKILQEVLFQLKRGRNDC